MERHVQTGDVVRKDIEFARYMEHSEAKVVGSREPKGFSQVFHHVRIFSSTLVQHCCKQQRTTQLQCCRNECGPPYFEEGEPTFSRQEQHIGPLCN